MTEDEFHGPRPAAQFDSVPVPELARLRRIERAAEAVCMAYDPSLAASEPDLEQAINWLMLEMGPVTNATIIP